MSLKIIDWKSGIVTTTGAVTSIACSFTAISGSTANIEAFISGRDTTSGDSCHFQKFAAIKDLAGTVTIIGSVLNVVTGQTDASLATASATITVSGTTVSISVTGVALLTIEWFADMRIRMN